MAEADKDVFFGLIGELCFGYTLPTLLMNY